jgi:polyisoprenoid-binding protein YceI
MILRSSSLALAALTFLGLASTTLAQTPESLVPSAVEPGAYVIEPSHTRVLFSVSHFGFNTYYGDFTGASGSLTLNPKAVSASKLDVSIPTASVFTTNEKLDGELKGEAWFDAAKFPTITFHSTKVTQTGPRTADVAGELTLHGVTRPVVLKASFHGAGVNPLDKAYTTGFEVSGKIKRSEFGVSTYVPLVGDEVDLIISAAFEKAKS